MVATLSAQKHHPRRHMQVLPHTALGWWALALMVLTAATPLLWPWLKHDSTTTRRMILTAVIALPSMAVAAVAFARRAARSMALVAITVVVALEICWAVWFSVSFSTL